MSDDLDRTVDELLAEKQRLTKRARASKRKGASGELEVKQLAIDAGFAECLRSFGSGATGGGDLVGVPGLHVECKRVERLDLPKAWRQATTAARASEIPVVAHRRNHTEWLATVPLKDFLALYAQSIQAENGGDMSP